MNTYLLIDINEEVDDEVTGTENLTEIAYSVSEETEDLHFASVLFTEDGEVHEVTLFDIETLEYQDPSKLEEYGYNKEKLIEQATQSYQEWLENQ